MKQKRRFNRGLWVLVGYALAVGWAWAAAPSILPNEASGKTEVLTPVQKRMQQKITVDFRETPIEDVLRVLAKQADVDVVKSPLRLYPERKYDPGRATGGHL